MYHFFSILPLPTRPTLFPYTTLFRSQRAPAFGIFVGRRVLHQGQRRVVITINDATQEAEDLIPRRGSKGFLIRSEEHTSELQSQSNLVCRLLLEKKKKKIMNNNTRSQ